MNAGLIDGCGMLLLVEAIKTHFPNIIHEQRQKLTNETKQVFNEINECHL